MLLKGGKGQGNRDAALLAGAVDGILQPAFRPVEPHHFPQLLQERGKTLRYRSVLMRITKKLGPLFAGRRSEGGGQDG
jgi:hypothetical protein